MLILFHRVHSQSHIRSFNQSQEQFSFMDRFVCVVWVLRTAACDSVKFAVVWVHSMPEHNSLHRELCNKTGIADLITNEVCPGTFVCVPGTGLPTTSTFTDRYWLVHPVTACLFQFSEWIQGQEDSFKACFFNGEINVSHCLGIASLWTWIWRGFAWALRFLFQFKHILAGCVNCYKYRFSVCMAVVGT